MKYLNTQPTISAVSLTPSLGEWYANVFTYDSLDIAMCVNATTRYAIPISMRDCGEDHDLYVRLIWRIREAIRRLSLPDTIANHIVDEYRGGLIVAPTADRSVLGTMNDLIYHCESHLDAICEQRQPLDWEDVEYRLNTVPQKPLGWANSSEQLIALCRQVNVVAEGTDASRTNGL